MIKINMSGWTCRFAIFYRWHPEVALRYLPLVDFLKKRDGNILEVGSGGLGIAPYLKKRVIGLDQIFYSPYHELLERKTGSALNIPYNPSSFDYVICVDMLEHIPKLNRPRAIEEMLRVAKKNVIIAVPCGQLSLTQDKLLHTIYQKLYQRQYHFFKEQINMGLPEKSEIKSIIYKCAKKMKINVELIVAGNENLKLRYFLMRGWLSKNIFVNIFFRKVLLLFLPIFKRLNSEPVYRQIFYITLRK